LLLEYGIEIPQGRAAVGRGLAEILEDAANGLSDRFRAELRGLAEELRHLDERVAYYDAQIEMIAQSHPQAQALMTIPGLGAKGATALVAAVGEDLRLFRSCLAKNYGVMRAFSSSPVQGRVKSACFDGAGLKIGF